MGKIVISKVDEAPTQSFPELQGVSQQGSSQTRAVVASPERPLWLWMHELAPGATLRWELPAVGHIAYVWKGGATLNCNSSSTELAPESVASIAHKASASITAGRSGATLLHYHCREDVASNAKAGGCVHVAHKDGVIKVYNPAADMWTTVWADSQCKTCDLWLHLSTFGKPRPQGNAHFHTEDEIIFVVKGGMIVGRHVHQPGTALAIDANVTYGFGVEEGGLAFTNFRPCEPHFVMMSREGPMHEPISEYKHLETSTLVSRQS